MKRISQLLSSFLGSVRTKMEGLLVLVSTEEAFNLNYCESSAGTLGIACLCVRTGATSARTDTCVEGVDLHGYGYCTYSHLVVLYNHQAVIHVSNLF
jgi:hypothetical protein